jgi:hypothetical protein
LSAEELPASTASLLAWIAARQQQMETFIATGALAQVYFPAMEAKYVALVLDDRSGDLPAARREHVRDAVKRLVASAWDIDRYGDLGDKPKLIEAFAAFKAAVKDLEVASAARP